MSEKSGTGPEEQGWSSHLTLGTPEASCTGSSGYSALQVCRPSESPPTHLGSSLQIPVQEPQAWGHRHFLLFGREGSQAVERADAWLRVPELVRVRGGTGLHPG